tara:strand:+ start:4510 stop:5808 length:1299 start_codon:yes stop_codon:yes gene_type:complete
LPVINRDSLKYLFARLGGYGASSVVDALAAFVISVALGRLFGSAVLGDYVFAQGVGILVSLLIGLGVSHSLLVQSARGDGDRGRILRRAIRLTLALQGAGFLIGLLVVWIVVAGDRSQAHTYLFVLLPGLATVSSVFFAYGAGCDQLQPYVGVRLGVAVSKVLLLCGFFLAGFSAVAFAQLLICIESVGVFGGLWSIWRHHPAGLKGPWRFEREDLAWLRSSAHLGISQFVGQVTLRVDAVMIRLLLSREAAGIYGAARTLAAAPRVLENALLLALTPKQGKAAKRGGSELWSLTGRILGWVIALTALEIVILGVFAPYLVLGIYGPEYQESILPMRLLLFALPLTGSAVILRSAAYCADRAPAVTRVALVVGAVNVIGNAALIPFFGLYGAVAASLFSLVIWSWGLARIVAEPLPTAAAPLAEESDAGDLS